jgi:hypothetical protein
MNGTSMASPNAAGCVGKIRIVEKNIFVLFSCF